jgi:hypothetical protein
MTSEGHEGGTEISKRMTRIELLTDRRMKRHSKKWYQLIGGSKCSQKVKFFQLAIPPKKIGSTNGMN